MCQRLKARPVMKIERVCKTAQTNIIVLAPNLSIRRPMNGEATAKTSMAKVCTDERVALSKLNSSKIGLKKILIEIALNIKKLIQEAITIYQPKNRPCLEYTRDSVSLNIIYSILYRFDFLNMISHKLSFKSFKWNIFIVVRD